MKKLLAISICLLMALFFVSEARASDTFTVLQSTTTLQGAFQVTSMTVQNGSDPLNEFGVDRVVFASLSRVALTPLILEPSLGNNSQEYKVGSSSSDFGDSLAASFARAGFDVYLYSPRETFLAHDQCAAPGSCPEAAGWGFAADIADLAFVQALIATHDRVKPAIGGYSLGGITGLAAVNANPAAFSGLLLIDSPIVVTDPTLQANYGILCGASQSQLASGQVLDDTLDPLAQLLVQLELQAPSDPSPVPIFPPGTTNRQAYLAFFTSPQPGPPASIFPPGFQLATGSVASGFAVASEANLNTQVNTFNQYIPTAIFRDVECSFAGSQAFTSNLSSFKAPALTIEFDKGFGALDENTLPLLGTSDSDIIRYSTLGHVDALTAPVRERRELLDDPIVSWMYYDVISRL